jgi:hypothetical protein
MDVARYPNISDHGLIGDLQTAALVSDNGTYLDYQLDHGAGSVLAGHR